MEIGQRSTPGTIWQILWLFPILRREGQFVEFGAGFAPGVEMLVEEGDEALAVGGFQQVGYFVDDDVFEQFLGLFDQFGVEADVAGAVVAAAPLGFHALEEVAADPKPELGFPFADDGRDGFVQQGLVPFVHDCGALGSAAAGADVDISVSLSVRSRLVGFRGR